MAGRVVVTAEVMGIGADGTEPSVGFAVHRHGVYSADKTLVKRYLFNCGEGTQRLCGENGVKLNSLDAIFLTRLGVKSASGIPGLVFALGGLGAAHLRIHGPVGTTRHLGAMQSFVRRRYPQLECVEVAGETPEPVGDIRTSKWEAGAPQEDAYARIIAVPLEGDLSGSCPICSKCTPLGTAHVVDKAVSPASGDGNLHDKEREDPDRVWLRRYYESKGLQDKITYVDTILRRYAGRIEELKAQLVAKYGAEDASTSSSSSSESDDSDVETDKIDVSAPLNRKWLEQFYKKYEPAKLARIDQILKQFAWREDQLKAMLLGKYSSERVSHSEPPTKRLKMDLPNTSSSLTAEHAELPPVHVICDSRQEQATIFDSSASICYIMQFRTPPYPVVWIIDCQTTSQVEAVIARFPLLSCDHKPSLVVHLSPPHIVSHQRYQNWTDTACRAAQHLVFDGKSLRSVHNGLFSFAFMASAHSFAKTESALKGCVDSRWRALRELLGKSSQQKHQLQIHRQFSCDVSFAHVAQAKLAFSLGSTAIPDYLNTGWIQRNENNEDDVEEGVSGISSSQSHTNSDQASSLGRRKLTILGTGSAAPSKLRASTSIYLRFDEAGSPGILIDCGEGAYGQLTRRFQSQEELDECIGGLKCIWISHHHADHQCGVLRVLCEYVQIAEHSSRSKKLFLIAPEAVLDYVKAWLPQLPLFVRLATCTEANYPPYRHELMHEIREYVDDFRSIKVWHCHDAHGLILRLRDGAKLVYSGDTKPCDQLVRAGLDATLLIHEATFDDTMEDDAEKKKHSTVGQALDVAHRMRARRVVLTHFSQRYPSLPPPMTVSSDTSTSVTNSSLEAQCAYDGFTIDV